MSRAGRAKDHSDGPTRKCIATGELLPTRAMVRFVAGPDGQVVPDILGRLPGRGIWVKADRSALDTAINRRLFARAARMAVQVPDDLLDQIEGQLLGRVSSLLALARKAGDALAGYEKTKAALATGDAAVLMQASDGSARGKSKLKPPPGEDTYIGCLTASEIGLAFGRDSVIHGALTAGGLTTRVVEEATRLSGVRENDDGGSAAEKDTKNA